MPSFRAKAPGKVILLGEHAVVYGQPALAIPVEKVRVQATVSAEPLRQSGSMHIQAPDVALDADLTQLPEGHPIAVLVRLLLQELAVPRLPACRLRITSSIPVASGLGSGTAVSVAVLRVLSAFLGQPLAVERVSALAYEVEKLYHGTPSGIDNTVIAYARPVYFRRGWHIQTLSVSQPFTIVIGDTGLACPTALTVSDVRRRWEAHPAKYEHLFARVGELVDQARQLIERGALQDLGPLMNQNQLLLQDMDVSSNELEQLIAAARSAGALGAKLSGSGRGGNMIALAPPEQAQYIAQALERTGAVRTIITQIHAQPGSTRD
jgi:mevalonate kinase